jgi:hypothetical protein
MLLYWLFYYEPKTIFQKQNIVVGVGDAIATYTYEIPRWYHDDTAIATSYPCVPFWARGRLQ